MAVLHNVIIGADKTSLERHSSIAPIMQHYVTQFGKVLKSGALNSKWRVDFNAATGSWRKSAVEFTEQPYGFLPLSENSLLPFTQCAVAAILQKV